MNVIAFPIMPRPTPVDVDRLLTVQRFRDWLPTHRAIWFDSLSDADQARMARGYANMIEGK